MQYYQDTIRSQNGAGVGYGYCLVQQNGVNSTIYDIDGVAIANPIRADGIGRYAFKAANGSYDLTFSGANIVTYTNEEVILFDPADVGVYDVFSAMTEAQREDVSTRTGSLNVSTAVNAALLAAYNAGHKTVVFPAGKYYCGQYNTAATIFDLTTYGNDFSIVTEGVVEFVCQTTAVVVPQFFKITNNSRFNCGHIRFRDLGYDPLAVTDKGAVGFLVQATGTAFEQINIDSIAGEDLTAPLMVQGVYTNRVKNINVGAIFSKNCYYGYNGNNQGDSVKIGAIYAYQNYRPVFVYGITGFETTVYNWSNRATSASINISRSVGGYNTEAVKIRYIARDCSNGTHVGINHIDLLGGTISNIDIEVDIEQGSAYTPVRFMNYDGAGNETSAASSNVVADVTIRGRCDSNAATVNSSSATYTNANGIVNFYESQYLLPNANMFTQLSTRYINVNPPTLSFTPLLEGITTAGAGTYTTQLGRAQRFGNRVFVDLTLIWTAHTGTGNMRVNLNDITWSSRNVNANFGWNVTVVYSSLLVAANKEIGAQLQNNSKLINLYAQDPAGGALALVPMDTAGSLYISFSYEIST